MEIVMRMGKDDRKLCYEGGVKVADFAELYCEKHMLS